MIRPLQRVDTRELYRLIDANRPYLMNLVWVNEATELSTEQFIIDSLAREKQGILIIRAIIVDSNIAGVIELRYANDSVQIGYWLGNEYRGLGVTTDAVNDILAYTAGPVTARIKEKNISSLKVLMRNGFKIVGAEPGWVRLQWH